METKRIKKELSPFLLVILSFLLIIAVGSVLLTFPFSQTSGQFGNYLDSLFIATSATCVTGLSTYADGIGNVLTLSGQAVVMVLIQIGGLGFITFVFFIISIFRRRISFKERYVAAQAVNATDIASVSSFIRKILLISLSFETIGFVLGIPAFLSIPDISVENALWYSAFTSISAFNNAGFDVFGSASLIRGAGTIVDSMPMWAYYYMCSYIMLLIIFGGISFLTIMDVFSFKKKHNKISLFTKVTLITTAILLVSGFIGFLLSDAYKPDSVSNFNAFDALFQSVTCRTAGFAIFDQSLLTTEGKVLSCLLMFIGGSPASTAGGIKTTTIFLILLASYKYLRGKKVTAFKRKFSHDAVLKAMTIGIVSIFIILIGFFIINYVEQNNTLIEPINRTENIAFEAFSAYGTVGLSANITPLLSDGSKIVLIVLMYIGRLGPMTMLQLFQNSFSNKENIHFGYAEENILIG